MTDRDELDRWAECIAERRRLEAFLEWCYTEKRMDLEGIDDTVCIDRDALLNDYFHIDYARLEEQRRALLDEHRRATGQEV